MKTYLIQIVTPAIVGPIIETVDPTTKGIALFDAIELAMGNGKTVKLNNLVNRDGLRIIEAKGETGLSAKVVIQESVTV